MGKWETVSDFILGGSKITADGDCGHEIKRRLLLGRKVMTNLDSIFKSRDITLPTKHCDPMNRSSPGLPVHHHLPEFTQTYVHRVCDAIRHLILCCPLLLLPAIPPSIRVFSNESTLRMRWPKYWSFSFRIIPSKETPGLSAEEMMLLNCGVGEDS